ncbi:response regulator [Kineococcus sp. R86509]|uniref:response regulator n=1 Tax=Kineococcus sp. R86509 TaxID=3093851 RepID=UPI0036D40E57
MTAVPGVLLVDDHAVVRAGLRAILEASSRARVVGEAGSVAEALEALTRLQPDVAVVDGRLPDGSGVEAARQARAISPRTRVLMLTSFDDDDAFLAAVLAGAVGYLRKEVRTLDLTAAVLFAASGGSTIDRAQVEQVKLRLADPLGGDERFGALTTQERRVLGHIADGLSNRDIAGAMNLAEKTVKNYVSSVFEKLHLRSRTQAALMVSPGGGRRDEHQADLGHDR